MIRTAGTPQLLIVDDEPNLLQALSVRLGAAGFVCETATDGVEALTKLQAHRPDLIIVDLIMPNMDGYELYRRLKEDAATASIPVLVLTAVPPYALGPRISGLGAVRVLHKPFDSVELIAAVRGVLATAV